MTNKESDWFNKPTSHRKMVEENGVVSEDTTTVEYVEATKKPVSSAAAPIVHSNGNKTIVDGVVTSIAAPQWGMTI